MSLLISYSKSKSKADLKNKAIYLDRDFYEIIFKHCYNSSNYRILKTLVSINKKSAPKVIENDRLNQFNKELLKLCKNLNITHPQFNELMDIANTAISKREHLWFSG
jgi:hypothetical protein